MYISYVCMNYYVIHYEDGTKDPIVVKAEDRGEARDIGENNGRVAAAVREDEGTSLTEEEKEKASTKDNP